MIKHDAQSALRSPDKEEDSFDEANEIRYSCSARVAKESHMKAKRTRTEQLQMLKERQSGLTYREIGRRHGGISAERASDIIDGTHFMLREEKENADITGSDLARIIKRPDETIRISGDRVRHWTNRGLLSVSGNKHPGTGKSVRYKHFALLEAVFIRAMVDGIGIPVGEVGSLFQKAKKQGALGNIEDTILIIGKSLATNDFHMSAHYSVHPNRVQTIHALLAAQTEYDIYIVVDLKKLSDAAKSALQSTDI